MNPLPILALALQNRHRYACGYVCLQIILEMVSRDWEIREERENLLQIFGTNCQPLNQARFRSTKSTASRQMLIDSMMSRALMYVFEYMRIPKKSYISTARI
jgi:hypothetical protein